VLVKHVSGDDIPKIPAKLFDDALIKVFSPVTVIFRNPFIWAEMKLLKLSKSKLPILDLSKFPGMLEEYAKTQLRHDNELTQGPSAPGARPALAQVGFNIRAETFPEEQLIMMWFYTKAKRNSALLSDRPKPMPRGELSLADWAAWRTAAEFLEGHEDSAAGS
jgi:hypothetical protein